MSPAHHTSYSHEDLVGYAALALCEDPGTLGWAVGELRRAFSFLSLRAAIDIVKEAQQRRHAALAEFSALYHRK